jgi:hypothetical protein
VGGLPRSCFWFPGFETNIMISKCIALLVAALVLANCCISGSGCAPPGGPVAWDGLGPAPSENTQPVEPRSNRVRSKSEIIVGPIGAAEGQQNGRLLPRDSWEQQQAADQDDEMRLKRKLMICRDCGTREPTRDDPTASMAR